MRWLPLPTCRIPLRRYTASLTIAALLLPMFAVPLAQADGEAAPTGAASPAAAATTETQSGPQRDRLCLLEHTADGDRGNIAREQKKFKEWDKFLTRSSEEHKVTAGSAGKDAIVKILTDAKKTDHMVEEAAKRQKNYLDYFEKSTLEVCEAHNRAFNSIKAANDSISKKLKAAKSEGCMLSEANDQNQAALERINELDEIFNKKWRAIRDYHKDYASYNYQAVSAEEQAAPQLPAASQAAGRHRVSELKDELTLLWGSEEEVKTVIKESIHDKSVKAFFSSLVKLYDSEKNDISILRIKLHANAEPLKKAAEGCGSLTSLNKGSNEAGQAGSTVSGETPAQAKGGVNGTCPATTNAVSGDGKTLNPCRSGTGEQYLDPKDLSVASAGPTPTGSARPPAASRAPGDGNPTPPANPTRDGSGVAQPVIPAAEEESWVSKNSTPLIIGGVGIAAVAGALVWKKTEDDKAKKDARYMEIEAATTAQTQQKTASSAASSTTSIDGGTVDSTVGGSLATNQTPMGSSLMIEGSPSGSVSSNTSLPNITVKVVNPSGIMTTDSATDITVSCASSTPAPCTLTGTVTVNTDMGKAVFSGLTFTGAHTNVKLQFYAPGFPTVVSGNFDVTARQ